MVLASHLRAGMAIRHEGDRHTPLPILAPNSLRSNLRQACKGRGLGRNSMSHAAFQIVRATLFRNENGLGQQLVST